MHILVVCLRPCEKDAVIYNREKDKQSTTAGWFNELLSREPWFKDIVPEVGKLFR